MKADKLIAQIIYYQRLTGTTDADIRRITGWSISTMRRRWNRPETITLGEAEKITEYLGMRE